ncbi:MAG: hypothetical protein FWF71_02810 [Actinomycetia bacterium]|nr:hypothetical protein [Actinomycetes bacterium]
MGGFVQFVQFVGCVIGGITGCGHQAAPRAAVASQIVISQGDAPANGASVIGPVGVAVSNPVGTLGKRRSTRQICRSEFGAALLTRRRDMVDRRLPRVPMRSEAIP